MGEGDYEQTGQLPVNDYVYVVNNTKTSCTDPDAVVEIVNRQIEITTSMDLDCDIYVDIEALTGGGITLISFTIDGVSYSAEYGMTWDEWIDSDYNTDSYKRRVEYASDNINIIHIVKDNKQLKYATSIVLTKDTINSGGIYILGDISHSGGS